MTRTPTRPEDRALRGRLVPGALALAAAVAAAGCSTACYATMEKVGVHKRDIMVDRVGEARDSQREAKEEFADALFEEWRTELD